MSKNGRIKMIIQSILIFWFGTMCGFALAALLSANKSDDEYQELKTYEHNMIKMDDTFAEDMDNDYTQAQINREGK